MLYPNYTYRNGTLSINRQVNEKNIAKKQKFLRIQWAEALRMKKDALGQQRKRLQGRQAGGRHRKQPGAPALESRMKKVENVKKLFTKNNTDGGKLGSTHLALAKNREKQNV